MLARCAVRSISYKPITTRLTQSITLRSTSIRMASTLPKLPIFEAIANHDPHSTVVIHSISGRRFTYGNLLNDVWEAKNSLHQLTGGANIEGERIAFLAENGYDYVGASLPVPTPTAFPGKFLMKHSDPAFDPGYQIHCSSSFVWLSRQRASIHT